MSTVAFLAMAFAVIVGVALAIQGVVSEKSGKIYGGCGIAVASITGWWLWGVWAEQYVELLWFRDLGQAVVFWTNFKMKLIIGVSAAILSGSIVGLKLKWFWQPLESKLFPSTRKSSYDRYRDSEVITEPRLMWFQILLPYLRWLITVAVGVTAWYAAASYYQEALLFVSGGEFGEKDPVFGYDLSFYLYRLQLLRLVVFVLTVGSILLIIVGFIGLLLMAMNTDDSWDEKERADVAIRSGRRVLAFAVILPVTLAYETYLGRYAHLFDQDHRIAGVSWVDANVLLPASWILVLSLLVSAVLVWGLRGTFGTMKAWKYLIGAGLLPVVNAAIIYLVVSPIAVHSVLKGSEFQKEQVYIERTIAATRKGFGLEKFKIQSADPKGLADISLAELKANAPATLDNLRLWDPAALAPTITETQALKGYYTFPDTDIDRYLIDGKPRQFVLSTRELDPGRLPPEAHSWMNDHILYTHGYGVVASIASETTGEGNPLFRLKDMPVQSSLKELTVTRPQIYFGEYTNSHVYVNEKMEVEFDHPSDDGAGYAKTAFQGKGGIPVGSGLRRLAISWMFDGFRGWTSDSVAPDSRLLFRRTIQERVGALAPWLHIDADPYKVIRPDGTLVYVIDGYTGSSSYPYSRAPDRSPRNWNYLRNSVKVVLDAYDGTVTFYETEEDPILNVWKSVYPGLIKPLSEMPEDLERHLRYPEELFYLQAFLYGSYHMEPEAWFQQLDRWEPATDAVNKDRSGNPYYMEPYYVVGQLPGETKEEFLLFLPLTAQKRNNLSAWMVARCDGEHRNEVRVYRYSSQHQVLGPALIRGRIEQDGQLSAFMTFWRQKGSQIVNGNLLALPVAGTLLYVEPLYIKAESNPTPQLKLVVVAIGDKIGWGETFDKALEKLFSGTTSSVPILPPGAEGIPSSLLEAPKERLETATKHFNRYLELTGQGKLQEAGAEFEALKRVLNGN